MLSTHSGTVKLSESLSLVDVLYLPCFYFNLIFISKLVSSLNYKLTFLSNKFHIKDASSLKMIGTVDANDGLYKLVMPSAFDMITTRTTNDVAMTFFCNKVPMDLWHFHLGHASHDRLHVMKQSYPIIFNDKSFVCDTCHRAKHIMLPFPNSMPFILLIWYMLIFGDHVPILPWMWSSIFLNCCWWSHQICLGLSQENKSWNAISFEKLYYSSWKTVDTKVKTIRSDNGAEFLMHEFYASNRYYSPTILCWDTSTKCDCWKKASTSFKCYSCFVISITFASHILVFCSNACFTFNKLFANSFSK